MGKKRHRKTGSLFAVFSVFHSDRIGKFLSADLQFSALMRCGFSSMIFFFFLPFHTCLIDIQNIQGCIVIA